MTLKPIKLNLITSLLLVFCFPLSAQFPGAIGHETLWLQGDFNQKAARTHTLNFHPALRFDQHTTGITIHHDIYELRQATIFTVYQDTSPDRERPVWEMTGDFGDLLLSTQQVSSKQWKRALLFAKKGLGTSAIEKPGAVINTYTHRMGRRSDSHEEGQAALIQFGTSNDTAVGNRFSGSIAEFIVYEKILKAEEVAAVESYLALKYGITLKNDYLNTAQQVVWDRKHDPLFSNNIAGIGRDDRATLYQKQSTSSNQAGKLIIGVGEIAEDNRKNTGKIDDRNYLIWGENAAAFRFDRVIPTAAGEVLLSDKQWLMNASGSTAYTLATELKIDIQDLPALSFSKENFCLLIDRSGTGAFSPETSLLIQPESISPEGIATFRNIFWDTDQSGKDLFSFGLIAGAQLESEQDRAHGISGVHSFLVYPNPATDGHYQLSVTLDQPTDIEIQVYDVHQRLITTQAARGQATYQLTGAIDDVPGWYTILLITPTGKISQNMIIH